MFGSLVVSWLAALSNTNDDCCGCDIDSSRRSSRHCSWWTTTRPLRCHLRLSHSCRRRRRRCCLRCRAFFRETCPGATNGGTCRCAWISTRGRAPVLARAHGRALCLALARGRAHANLSNDFVCYFTFGQILISCFVTTTTTKKRKKNTETHRSLSRPSDMALDDEPASMLRSRPLPS